MTSTDPKPADPSRTRRVGTSRKSNVARVRDLVFAAIKANEGDLPEDTALSDKSCEMWVRTQQDPLQAALAGWQTQRRALSSTVAALAASEYKAVLAEQDKLAAQDLVRQAAELVAQAEQRAVQAEERAVEADRWAEHWRGLVDQLQVSRRDAGGTFDGKGADAEPT